MIKPANLNALENGHLLRPTCAHTCSRQVCRDMCLFAVCLPSITLQTLFAFSSSGSELSASFLGMTEKFIRTCDSILSVSFPVCRGIYTWGYSSGQIRGNPASGTVKEELHADDPDRRVEACQDADGSTGITENGSSVTHSQTKGVIDGEPLPMDIDVGPNVDTVDSTSEIDQDNKDDCKMLLSFSSWMVCKSEIVEKCQNRDGEVDNEFDDMATLDQVFARKRPGLNSKKNKGATTESVKSKSLDIGQVKDELDEFKSAQVLHDLHKCDAPVEGLVALRAAAQLERERSFKLEQEGAKRVIVVGAGPAGLSAARHLRRMNYQVTILEARHRVGGRVFTDRKTFSAPVDLGASIITGKKNKERSCE